MESKKYTLNKEDAKEIGKVALYTIGSTFAGLAVVLIAQIDGPAWWIALAPFLNLLAVAAKKYFDGELSN